MRPTSFAIRGTAARYSEAAALLQEPGDCAIVERGGTRRQIVIACPDGCGEKLSINLDPRSGPAWRLYERRRQWSLFPSIDKTSGCRSHFILWGGHITWCDFEGGGAEPEWPSTIADRVLEFLRAAQPASYVAIAEELDEIPWDVLAACHHLVRQELVFEGEGRNRGIFTLQK
jgi:hypothetical protein